MTDSSFPSSCRLLLAADFKRVFDAPDERVGRGPFLALARSGRHPASRLGIVVGKKNVSAAHQRNRIKRQVRESFRHQEWPPATLDIVLLVRKGADRIESTRLRASLQEIWRTLQRKSLDSGKPCSGSGKW